MADMPRKGPATTPAAASTRQRRKEGKPRSKSGKRVNGCSSEGRAGAGVGSEMVK
jgi:hypothetical protein